MWYTLNEPRDVASTSLPSPSLILQVPTNPICIKWYHTDVPTNPPQLFNGHFWRLSTIHRTGDTSFTIEGTKVRLTGELLKCALCRRDYRMLSYIALFLANIAQTSYFLQILDKLQPTLEWMLQQPTTTPLQSSWALGLVFIFWIIPGVIFWPVLRKFLSLSLHLLIRMYIYFVGVCWDNSKYCRLWNLHWCRGWWTY